MHATIQFSVRQIEVRNEKQNSGEQIGKLLAGFAKDITLNKIHGYPDKEKIQDYLFKKVKEVSEDLVEESNYYTKEEKEAYKNRTIKDVTEKFSKTFKKIVEKGNVEHPIHYGGDKPFEVIKVLEAWNLDFHLGNVVKYVYRAGIKDVETEIEDLEKAKWYLQRKIELLKKDRE